jgi:predicted DCC family thiol-disulfide oxidoreductase YuxK
VHVVTADGEVLSAGKAWLFVLDQIGYRRTAAVLSLPPLSWIVELGYRIVAHNRRFFARFLFRRG